LAAGLSLFLSFRLPNQQQPSILPVQFHHYGVAQPRVRDAVAENDPAIGVAAALSAHGPGDVHRFVSAVVQRIALLQDCNGPDGGIIAQDPARATGGIFAVPRRQKEDRAKQNPRGVEQPVAPEHARYHSGPMTRSEIEAKLTEIVRKEKDVADDKMTLETPLAEAGIDSLDALTILFAIEEEFHISIPDDRARAIRTFGDMVEVIEALV